MSEKSSLLSNCNPRKFFTIRLYVFSWVESNANRLYNVIKTFLIKSGLYKLICRWKWNWNFKVSLEGSRKFYFLFHLKIAQPLDREEKLTFSGCRFKLLHGFTTRNHLSDLRLIWKNPSLKADTRYASAESQKWKGQFHEPFAFRQKTDPLNRSFRRRTHSLLLRLRQHTPHPLLCPLLGIGWSAILLLHKQQKQDCKTVDTMLPQSVHRIRVRCACNGILSRNTERRLFVRIRNRVIPWLRNVQLCIPVEVKLFSKRKKT